MYAEDRDFVRLHVKDNGSGISKDKQKSLFKRFYEGDYRKFNTIGTGIGLSLVKDLVELHGGSIEVESEEGRGTEFIVTLPVDRSYFKEEQIDEEAVLPVQKTVTYLEEENAENVVAEKPKAHTILVVEDNEELLQLMVRLLKREYNVHTAENGQEAVTVLDNEDIDLIVSDVMMPVMDGLTFCTRLKHHEATSHIPVLLLTARSSEQQYIEGLQTGADIYMTKPFSADLLLANIASLLANRQKLRQLFNTQNLNTQHLNTTPSQHSTFNTQHSTSSSPDRRFLDAFLKAMEKHMSNTNLKIEDLGGEVGLSRVQLYRKVKALTGMTPVEILRETRLKRAMQLLKTTDKTVSEIANEVGFATPGYFSSCFKKQYDKYPTDVREEMKV